MWKKCFLFIIAVFAFSVFTGCNQVENNNVKMEKYENDGYLGLTKSMPNLPTNPSFHNYRKDTELVQQSLKDIKGVLGTTVTITDGENMLITVQVPKDSSNEAVKKIKKSVYEATFKQLPRYNITVRSNKSG
ncbi:hypothetical protein [Chengkuizengella axinellae]|uniref:Sporulation protein n=1 Tax=Chengkuizengella axinellae TaxID=3064388 RepID=A0ABT9IZ74_9BACL|nr:hypothetical protein [Chengkuizengella sp. 2205SS18-9]MDP5274658.1 hypothetical protein [Chengkuizengella sp. 2205SS18-9]